MGLFQYPIARPQGGYTQPNECMSAITRSLPRKSTVVSIKSKQTLQLRNLKIGSLALRRMSLANASDEGDDKTVIIS